MAIIASIFAIAFAIRWLPAPTREALLPVIAERTLPSRAIHLWSAIHEGVRSDAAPAPAAALPEVTLTVAAPESPALEPTGAAVPLTFDVDPGEAPLIAATPSLPVALPVAIAAVHSEAEIGNSLLAVPFTKTGSALRVAFAKTGSAIKAAASGTAGVFVSNP